MCVTRTACPKVVYDKVVYDKVACKNAACERDAYGGKSFALKCSRWTGVRKRCGLWKRCVSVCVCALACVRVEYVRVCACACQRALLCDAEKAAADGGQLDKEERNTNSTHRCGE